MTRPEPRTRLTARTALGAVLLSIMTLLGLLGTAVIALDWLHAVGTYFFDEARCTIDSSSVTDGPEGGYRLEVSYRYRYAGETFAGAAYRHGGADFDEVSDAEREAARLAPGAEVPCWVDPDDPASAYLERADLWQGLWILMPLVFVAVGAGTLWFLLLPRSLARLAGRLAGGRSGGHRGAALLVGFFGLFLLAGVGLLIPFFLRPALEVLAARSWRPVPCEILSSSVETHPGDDGATYSVEVLYRYEVDGREHRSGRYQFMGGSSGGYEAKAAAVARIPAGTETTCYVNPRDPFEAVIERGFSSDFLAGIVPLLFALVGLGGIVFTVTATRGMKKDAGRPSWLPWSTAESPDGRREGAATGALVLEPRQGPLGKLGCAVLVALLWNGIVFVVAWQVVESWRAGNQEWLLSLFVLPFVVVGLALAAAIPYGILALLNPRPRLRLTPAAVTAGRTAEIVWTFRGAAGRIRRLKIWLESSRTTTETEVHDRGASIRTRTEVLDTLEILDRSRETPLDLGTASFQVPAGAPPTSTGEEAISWKIKLQGVIDYWPDVAEEYEIRVLPPEV